MSNPKLTSYIIGFAFSIILTLVAFGLTKAYIEGSINTSLFQILIPVLIGLALIQLAVQMIFFLHIRQDDQQRYRLLFFISTFALILLLVVASLWIMTNLNYHMSTEQMSDFLIEDEGIKY